MVLIDRGLTTEIAQFALSDLTFKVHYHHFIYSSTLVKNESVSKLVGEILREQ